MWFLQEYLLWFLKECLWNSSEIRQGVFWGFLQELIIGFKHEVFPPAISSGLLHWFLLGSLLELFLEILQEQLHRYFPLLISRIPPAFFGSESFGNLSFLSEVLSGIPSVNSSGISSLLLSGVRSGILQEFKSGFLQQFVLEFLEKKSFWIDLFRKYYRDSSRMFLSKSVKNFFWGSSEVFFLGFLYIFPVIAS